MKNILTCLIFIVLATSCQGQTKSTGTPKTQVKNVSNYDTSTKTIHVFVALCDNKYQGIVPVPKLIGNGQDPNNNLYWGCSYGVKSYFKKSKEWKLLRSEKLDKVRMERLIFKHTTQNYYLVADAYDGQYIKKTTTDFLYSAAGQLKDTININKTTIGINGNAKLVAYIGHDGLMDFQLNENFTNADGQQRDAIILACISKKYFAPHLTQTKANPLVWTTGLMAPEAYTLHDALSRYIAGGTAEEIRTKSAMAYTKFQKCSLKASRNLLVTGY
ncbi:hypothetical protein LZQ00_12255 [Sphingobacterium sp. SRCM116780]|uniref:hypothetical protein n=1 Tax=Sphingobacterium sp. SRCM116780 TaxID=2907623 RepID=UPI001F212EAE|nr:hypothetical protein [Sphingobacterium sp. SRCM116780]UIR55051.1 hypothetical protein LZQ00_12255 [Sphingobacterium sp. SRCM116780]